VNHGFEPHVDFASANDFGYIYFDVSDFLVGLRREGDEKVED